MSGRPPKGPRRPRGPPPSESEIPEEVPEVPEAPGPLPTPGPPRPSGPAPTVAPPPGTSPTTASVPTVVASGTSSVDKSSTTYAQFTQPPAFSENSSSLTPGATNIMIGLGVAIFLVVIGTVIYYYRQKGGLDNDNSTLEIDADTPPKEMNSADISRQDPAKEFNAVDIPRQDPNKSPSENSHFSPNIIMINSYDSNAMQHSAEPFEDSQQQLFNDKGFLI